jgi:hypothetical protein
MTQNLLDDDLKTSFAQPKGINKYDIGIQFLIWIGIFFGCFIIAQTVAGIIIFAYYKSVDIKQIASNVYNLNALRYAQMIASLLGFLLPALLFSKLKENSFTKYANANIGFNPLFLVLIPMLIYAFYPLINVSFFVNKIMPWNDWRADYQSEYKFIVDGLLKDNSWFVLVLNMLTIAIIPAICEEWIFRGTLQKLFSEKLNIHLAILFSSIIFSFIHFEFSGFLPRIILGMFLGYLFYYSGSLWLNIFAHAVNNGSQVVLMYLNNKGIYKMDVDNPEMPAIWEILAYTAGFVVLWMIFYHFAQKNKKSNFAQ